MGKMLEVEKRRGTPGESLTENVVTSSLQSRSPAKMMAESPCSVAAASATATVVPEAKAAAPAPAAASAAAVHDELQYLQLVQRIIASGNRKEDRTGPPPTTPHHQPSLLLLARCCSCCVY